MTNNPQTIELSNLAPDHSLNRAMRRIARYWPVAYSRLLCLEWQWSDEIPYGATDGRVLLLNHLGLRDLELLGDQDTHDPVTYVTFLLAHEAAHALLNHGVRLERFADRHTANVAADYVVNGMIHHANRDAQAAHNLARPPFPIPEWAFLDLELSDPHTTEKLYQHLRKSPTPTPNQPDEAPTPHDDHPELDPAQDDPAPPPGGDGATPGADGPDKPGGVGGDVPPGDAGGRDPDGDGDPADDETPRLPGAGGDDTFYPATEPGEDPEQVEHLIEELNERVVMQDILESAACGARDLPEATHRVASDRHASAPQDWVARVEQFVDTLCRYGWDAPYNHGVYTTTGMCAPGPRGRKVGDIICVVDSSGSIGDEAWARFADLNQYLLDEVRPERLILVSCDRSVKAHEILEPGDEVPASLPGGGGTSFRAAFEWVEQDPGNLVLDPRLLLYFTDGHCTDHQTMDEPPYPVMWLSYNKPASHFPWGEFAEITLS